MVDEISHAGSRKAIFRQFVLYGGLFRVVSREQFMNGLLRYRWLVWGLTVLVLAGLASGATLRQIEAFKAALERDAPKPERQVMVLVANAPIGKGTRISAGALGERAVPLSIAKSGLIQTHNKAQVVGRPVPIALQTGDFLTAALFDSDRGYSLQDHLKPGHRLLPVSADGSGTFGSFDGIEFVDVWDTAMVLSAQETQELTVIEAGQEFGQAKLIAKRLRVVRVPGTRLDQAGHAHFLEVREEQVPAILKAQQSGRVRYVLAI
jgi:Flp pilus assembly protein CpaB